MDIEKDLNKMSLLVNCLKGFFEIIFKSVLKNGFILIVQKQPHHLAHYEENRGIREMLNLILEKGPATFRSTMANGISSSTSDEGGEPLDALPDTTSTRGPTSTPVAAPALAATTNSVTETERETDTEELGNDPPTATSPKKRSNSGSNEVPSQRAEGSVVNTSSQKGTPTSLDVIIDTPGEAGAGREGGEGVEEKSSSPRQSNKRAQATATGVELGTIDQAFRFSEHTPQPPGVFMAYLGGSGIPLPPTTTNVQYAASGGGLVINERYHGLPLHTNELASIKPHLAIFVHAYGIDIVSS